MRSHITGKLFFIHSGAERIPSVQKLLGFGSSGNVRKSLGQIYFLIRIEEREHPVVSVLIVRYTPHLSSEFKDTRIIFQHVVFLKIEFPHEIRGVGRSHIFFVPPEIIEQQRIFDI